MRQSVFHKENENLEPLAEGIGSQGITIHQSALKAFGRDSPYLSRVGLVVNNGGLLFQVDTLITLPSSLTAGWAGPKIMVALEKPLVTGPGLNMAIFWYQFVRFLGSTLPPIIEVEKRCISNSSYLSCRVIFH